VTREEQEHLERAIATRVGLRAKRQLEYDSAGKIVDGYRRSVTLRGLQEKIAANERDIALFEQRLKHTETQTEPPIQKQAPQKTVWTDTARAFGEHVFRLYERGEIKATSKMNALQQMSALYVQKNGSPMKPRSIYQSLRNKHDEGK